jgi:N-carbamoylputrescine amidase
MTSKEPVPVALIQMTCGPDKVQNIEKACALVDEAARKGAQLICLPELFATRYFCQEENHCHFDLAEPIPGPTVEALARVARVRNVCLVVPVFERRAAGVYHNSVALLDETGTLRGRYRKTHIPDDPLYFEKFYFTPGDTGPLVARLAGIRVAPLICWDQWFPELARVAALKGAELLVYPSAIGWHDHERVLHGEAQHDAWQTIQRAHAIANGVFVAAVNRVGREGTVYFWGASFVADPFGRILAQAGHEKEEVLMAELNLDLIETTRRHWPFLRDRRPDCYGDLLSLWQN